MFLPVIDPEATDLIDYPQQTGTPERRLLLAVLERAILDYVGNNTQDVAAAEAWLFDAGATHMDHWTFPWICQQLDLDDKRTAKMIRDMPRRGNSRVAPWYVMKRTNRPGEVQDRSCKASERMFIQ